MQAAHMRNSFKGASLREFFLALQLISLYMNIFSPIFMGVFSNILDVARHTC